jgi:hypothetical protein
MMQTKRECKISVQRASGKGLAKALNKVRITVVTRWLVASWQGRFAAQPLLSMQNEIDIVRDVSARLERGGLSYMLTGSMAMNYYAQPRMTRDIDIVVALAPQDADIVVRLFAPDYYVSSDAVRQSIAQESLFNLIHQESVIKVDCIVRKNSPYRRSEFDRRQRITIENFSIWIVSKEDLIISKIWWAKDSHSEIQLLDVKNLARTGCDMEHIERWTSELGVLTLWQECKP